MTEVAAGAPLFSGLCTRLALELVEWQLGPAGVAEVLSDAGETRCEDELRDDTSFSTYAQLRKLLEAVCRQLGSCETLLLIGQLPTIQAGSRPELTALIHAYGSPAGMAMAGMSLMGNAVRGDVREIGPCVLENRFYLVEGMEPYPELSALLVGMMPLVLRIFGLRLLEHVEVSCQCRGDGECMARLAWDETDDLAMQLDQTRFQLAVAQSRLESVHRTIEDIISTQDLDTVLTRIVESASRSTTASAFVLEIDDGTRPTKLYTSGIDDARAELLARATTAGDPGLLAVEVASKRRRYGRIMVSHPGAGLETERPALENYARLAATALDSAFALAEARRQADMSRALLKLSTSLAELTTAEELAAKVARTLPAVIDCDCAVVLLVDQGLYRVTAHHGFEPSEAADLGVLEVPVSLNQVDRVVVCTTAESTGTAMAVLAAMGLQALASAPISVDDSVIGVLTVGVHDDPARLVDDPYLAERFRGLAGQAAVALRNGRLLDQIRHQSLHDPLTDLPNRALLMDRAEQIIARAQRLNRSAAILFIDLDGFKDINDTLGHTAGDEVLKLVARRLEATVRGKDTVGRLGGDEFVILVGDTESGHGVEVLAQRILEALAKPLRIPGLSLPRAVPASIGIAASHTCSAGELLRDADMALYNAKAAGKACYRVFGPDMRSSAPFPADLGRTV